MKKLFSIVITITVFFPLLFSGKVNAADFDISIDINYSVNDKGEMFISEKRILSNNSKFYYIKQGSEEIFSIATFKTRSQNLERELDKIIQTISLKDGSGNDLPYKAEINNDQIEVKTNLPSSLHSKGTQIFELTYQNFELAEKNGNVWNIYVPGVSENYKKVVTTANGATTQTNYNISLELAQSLGEPNFVLPNAAKTEIVNEKRLYVFRTDDLIERSVWIQIGKKQFYSFSITQPVNTPLGTSSKVFNTWYELILPRESSSGNQQVYFNSISPEPDYVKIDGEGNVIARFTFSSDETSEIKVDGFIVTGITDPVSKKDVGNIESIDLSKQYAKDEDSVTTFEELIKPQLYWEVDAPEINQTAEDLLRESTNVYEILLNDYIFVTNNVDYDNLKVELLNERKGALSTLQGGSSVCMEYSDLLITLLRAQGIPARAAFGYGFDPRAESTEQEGHQWVEVYLPNVGWIAVDPTWGDTSRRNYIGGDVDHALWYVAGISVNNPSPVVKYSIGDVGDLATPQFEMTVTEPIETENFMSLSELLDKYKYTPSDSIQEKIDQLNVYGKIIFLGIPSILIMLIIVSILLTIGRRAQRRKRENFVHAGPASHDAPNNPYY